MIKGFNRSPIDFAFVPQNPLDREVHRLRIILRQSDLDSSNIDELTGGKNKKELLRAARSIYSNGSWIHYRATLVVEYLCWVDLDLGSSLAGGPLLVATYCPSPSRMVEHAKSKSTQTRY